MPNQQQPPSFDQLVDDNEQSLQKNYGAPIQAWAQSRGYDVENLPANITDLYHQFNQPAVQAANHVMTPQEQRSHDLAQIQAPEAMSQASTKLNNQAVIDQAAEQHANDVADDPMTGYTDVPKPQFADGGGVSFDSLQADPQQSAQQPQQVSATPQTPQMGSFEDLQDDGEKYGSTGDQIKAGLEGAAKGVLGPIAPTLERAFGARSADILGREKANPITSGIGQGIGLVGGAMTGVGEGALMEQAGKGAAEMAGLGAPTTYLAKVGSSAVSQAAEMAILQSSDEMSKAVLHDPDASAQTAIANIGLASALGGVAGGFITGAVSPLWKATVGDSLDNVLAGLTKKLNGTGPSELLQEADRLGIPLKPEVEAAMSDDPLAMSLASQLEQSDTTKTGRGVQEALSDFRTEAGNSIVKTAGRDGADVGTIEPSKYQSGKEMAQSLADEYEKKISPALKEMEEVKLKLKDEPLIPDGHSNQLDMSNPYRTRYAVPDQPGTVKSLKDQIVMRANSEDWMSSRNSDEAKMVRKAIKDLDSKKTIGDLVGMGVNIGNATKSTQPFGMPTPLSRAGQIVKSMIDDAVHDVSITRAGKDTPDLVLRLLNSKAEFKSVAQIHDALEGSLNAKGSVSGYAKMLRELGTEDGEKVLNRISGSGDARVLQVLEQHFPETAQKVRDYHIDRLIRAATDRQGGESVFNSKRFLKNLFEKDSMSPEMRNFIFKPEQLERMQAAGNLSQKLEDATHNWSNTARTVDKLSKGMGGTALSGIAFLTGHGALGALASILGPMGREGADAGRLAMLKWLGSSQPVKAEGFKAMVDFMHNVIKGETLLNSATSNIFKSGAQVLTDKMMPAKEDRVKLDKIVTKAIDAPDQMMHLTNGQTGHYMPDHQVALTQSVTQQVAYLAKLKPSPYQPSPLDRPIEPSSAAMARYHRALDIANQPSMVLQHVKDGTLQATDIQDLNAMSPALYQQMVQKINDQIAKAHSENVPIPYRTRMGLSLFLAQPIDSTMIPASIRASQPTPQAPQPLSDAPMKGRNGKSAINHLSGGYQTPGQAAEANKNKD